MAISSSTLSSGTGVTGSSIGVSNSTGTGAAGTPGASSAVGNQQQQGPSGRERAIEALIDREPQGSYYRAARVVVSQRYFVFSSIPPCPLYKEIRQFIRQSTLTIILFKLYFFSLDRMMQSR